MKSKQPDRMKHMRLYAIWHSMNYRCYSPKCKRFKNYGGRGITVCDEWKDNFSSFVAWALEIGYDENAPRGDYTLERIDVNGSYCPENCCFIPQEKQQLNKTDSALWDYNGRQWHIKELSQYCGLAESTIISRIKRGWSMEDAVTRPIDTSCPFHKMKKGSNDTADNERKNPQQQQT